MQGVGKALAGAATPSTVIYFKQGSCTGVAAILGTKQVPANGTYWSADGNVQTCTLSTAQAVDIGVSDVFATSCPSVTADQVKAAGVGDFDTFFAQVMEFVVPAASDQNSISAEAAYLTFGLGADGQTQWDNTDLHYIRNNTSGTQVMLGKAINVDAGKWIGKDQGGSGGVVTTVGTPPGDAKKTIGILSSGEADANPLTIKKLAFQAYGQTCAFWADSGASEKDKKYVRDGHYPVWGPLHVLAKVDDKGVPTNDKAKAVIDLFAAQDQSIVDIEIAAHVIPLCAMNVTRDSEIGPMSSIQPTGSCGCYFDSKTASAGTKCDVCKVDKDCTNAATPKCNYGYCEVK